MFKKHVALVLAVLASSGLFAQQRHVQGQVLSAENKQPLPGVTVKIDRTSIGTTTDQNGHFQLDLPGSKGVLSVSYVGRETSETEVREGDANLVILLKPSNRTLDEVVAVAYTNVKRSGYPGAVSTVSADKINDRLTPNITNALQGLVTGLQSSLSNGQPGNSSTIRIRGVGSINASSAPLFVVDGAPYDGDISALSTTDIASISVLKDATAANLYGSRAANGVIIITTKQGKKGTSNVDVLFNQGWSSRAVQDYDKLNTDQYFELYWEALRNKQLTNGLSAEAAAASASANIVKNLGINPYGANYPQPIGTDGKLVAGAKPLWNDSWEKAIQQSGAFTQAQLSFSGGNDKSTYHVSGGYLNNEGAYVRSGFKRYNIRSNLTLQAKPWLKVGLNLAGTSSLQDYPRSSDSQTDNVVFVGRAIPSFYPIYQRNEDGSFKLDENGRKQFDYGSYRPTVALANQNLIGTLPLDKNKYAKDVLSARSFVEASITKALHFKTSYNIDYTNANTSQYTNPEFGESAEFGGSIYKASSRTLGYTWNNIFTYDADLAGGHHLNLLAGHEYYYYNFSNLSGNRQKFVLPGLYEPAAASQLNDFTGISDNYTKLSFFGQGQYNYLNRYYFTASARRDGSSRFSPDSRWGTFWSVGASWRLSEETFLRNEGWLNELTLKGSYGSSGNDNLSSYYSYLALYSIKNNLGNGGVITSRLATPDLKWERNLNLNIGIDYGLLDNRVYGTINYYNRKSQDLLYAKPMAGSTGFTSISANIGALKNTGLELELNVIPVKTRDFRWTVGLNVARNKNEITELPQKEIISGTKKLMVGKSVYDFYLREWAGVDAATGNPLWYQTNAEGKKVTTTSYSNGSLYYAGTALPDVTGGFSNAFNYKGIELSFLLAYSLGGKVLDMDYVTVLGGGSSAGRNWSTELQERWTPTHTNTDVPRLTTDNLSWTSQSTRFLYDATYARLKTVSLGYDLPARLLSKVGIRRAKVYALGENLLTFYGHQGMDPEQSIDGTTYYQYPAMKTFSFGIQVGL